MRARIATAIAVMVLVTALPHSAFTQDKPGDPQLIKRGEQLYGEQKCSMCHSVAGKGNAKGPLDSVGAKLSEEEIRQWLISPRVMAEKTKATRKPLMPEYTKLSKDDLSALVTYLKSLNKK